jgi:hypothetical protein
MKVKGYLVLVVMIMATWACSKEVELSTKQKTSDLVVPGDFEWRTSQDLKVTITGLAVPKDFFSTLKIIDPSGKVIFSVNYSIRQNLVLSLTVPMTVNELTLTYGSRTLRETVQDGRLDFSFWQKDDKSDLGH